MEGDGRGGGEREDRGEGGRGAKGGAEEDEGAGENEERGGEWGHGRRKEEDKERRGGEGHRALTRTESSCATTSMPLTSEDASWNGCALRRDFAGG